MSNFEEYAANYEENNLISPKDVALIKIKLGKHHRKESDWDIIKNILDDKNLFTFKLKKKSRYLKFIHDLPFEEYGLMVFTNVTDLENHLFALAADGAIDINQKVEIGTVSISYLCELADELQCNVIIDFPDKPYVRFMVYESEGQVLKATMLVKPAE